MFAAASSSRPSIESWLNSHLATIKRLFNSYLIAIDSNADLTSIQKSMLRDERIKSFNLIMSQMLNQANLSFTSPIESLMRRRLSILFEDAEACLALHKALIALNQFGINTFDGKGGNLALADCKQGHMYYDMISDFTKNNKFADNNFEQQYGILDNVYLSFKREIESLEAALDASDGIESLLEPALQYSDKILEGLEHCEQLFKQSHNNQCKNLHTDFFDLYVLNTVNLLRIHLHLANTRERPEEIIEVISKFYVPCMQRLENELSKERRDFWGYDEKNLLMLENNRNDLIFCETSLRSFYSRMMSSTKHVYSIKKILPNNFLDGKIINEDAAFFQHAHDSIQGLSVNPPNPNTIFFNVNNGCYFSAAQDLLAKREQSKESHVNPIMEDILVCTEILHRHNILRQMEKKQSFFNSIQFLYFAQYVVNKIKYNLINPLNLSDVDKLMLGDGFERAMLAILTILELNDFSGIIMTEHKQAFYTAFILQQRIMLYVELLTQFPIIGKDRLNSLQLEAGMKKIMKAEHYASYELNKANEGINGLFNKFLDQIGLLQVLLDANGMHIFQNTQISFEEAEAIADKHYEELLKVLDKEHTEFAAQKNKASNEAKERKLKQMKRTQAERRAKDKAQSLSFFKAEPAAAVSQATSEQSLAYAAAGTLLSEGKNEAALTQYQAAKQLANDKQDHFYVTACLVEMSEYFNKKALMNLPNNLMNLGDKKLETSIGFYRNSLGCAKEAFTYFEEVLRPNLDSLDESYLSKIEDLSQSIHLCLHRASNALKESVELNEKYQSELKNQLNRLEAKRAIIKLEMGPKAWNNNPNANHRYANIRRDLYTQLDQLQISSVHVVRFINDEVKTIHDKYAYLLGKSALPLVLTQGYQVPSLLLENNQENDMAARQGSSFKERLSGNTERLLQSAAASC